MNSCFYDAWDKVARSNSIPRSIDEQINITANAPQQFIDEVILLESITDPVAQANEALQYLEKNNGINCIDYTALYDAFIDCDNKPKSFWRQMYLLERSIQRHDGFNSISWVDRLKFFVDTSIIESIVKGKQLVGLPGKLLFTRSSGNHECLKAGPGNFAADFYCWNAEENKPYAFVELKCSKLNDIDSIKAYYADVKKRYNARFVLVFLADHSFKLIDYNTDTIIEQPNLHAPNNLLIM